MVGKLVLRGLIVGIIAGILAFGFARTMAEPIIQTAINFESAQDDAARDALIAKGQTPPPEEPDMFSRDIQRGVGLATGVISVGTGIGILFSILFAFGYGRIGSLGPKPTAAVLAILALVTIYLVPSLKYPANPPAVGHEDTIKLRTGLYFLMMAISILSTFGALWLRKRLVPASGAWNASVIAGLAYIVVLVAVFMILPTINEVPANFSAVTLWKFRIDSLTTQIILWGSTGLMFGYAAESVLNKAASAPVGQMATQS